MGNTPGIQGKAGQNTRRCYSRRTEFNQDFLVPFWTHSSTHMQLKQQKIEELAAWNIRIQTRRLAKWLETWLGESQSSCCEHTILSIKDVKPFSTQLCRPGEATRGHSNKAAALSFKATKREQLFTSPGGHFGGWVCSRKPSSRMKTSPHSLVPALQWVINVWQKVRKNTKEF